LISATKVAENLQRITNTIAELSQQHAREPGTVRLLAVSKKKPASMIREVAATGHRDFGENYADEGAEKIRQLQDANLTWHFIGHIQSNKTRLIAAHYQWVQSVDRLKIATRLAAHLPAECPPLNICLQINIDGETTKSGCTPDEAQSLAAEVAAIERLTLRGIMAIPAPAADPQQQRAVFSRISALYRELQANHPTMDTLSMGMSGDMEAAIAEGSTQLRVGTAIFGARD